VTDAPPGGVPALRDAVGRACGSRVSAAVAVSGGDVARAGRFVLEDGRSVFAKAVAGPAGMLAAEAAGLAWLREGVAVAAGRGDVDAGDDEGWPVRVPRVLAVVDDEADPYGPSGAGDGAPPCPVPVAAPGPDDHRLLVLEWIPTRRGGVDAERLGRGLAALHGVGATRFGLGRTTWCGPLPQDNAPSPDWPTFYAERRLIPLARLAVDGGRLDHGVAELVTRVADRIHRVAGPQEPPARLHGDLWAGNVVAGADGAPWLVDPAAHGGHREVDLAMLRLFGGVSERAFSAYEEVHPLAEGAAARVRLWQLAPLLVHTILFGGGYGSSVRAAALAYL
jgi:fructosamine-3-kinase